MQITEIRRNPDKDRDVRCKRKCLNRALQPSYGSQAEIWRVCKKFERVTHAQRREAWPIDSH